MEDLPRELGWPAYRPGTVECWRGDVQENRQDWIAEEAPIALLYNGDPHVVMLATPLDLEDFALGFSLTEDIIASPGEVDSIRIYERAEGIEVRLRIDPARCDALPDRARNMTGRTGCGLCGSRTLRQAMRKPPPVREGVRVTADELSAALGELAERQTLNRLTGAVHAAAWAIPGQGVAVVREDVGRHNALDKLIGALARKGTNPTSGFVLVTSRASYEMVQKCAMAGIGFLAAISAPTGLAVRRAEAAGVTLVGFARGDRHVVYAHPHRLFHSNHQT